MSSDGSLIEHPTEPHITPWLSTLRRYLLVVVSGMLIWETLHLPLYTIWREGTTGELVFAVVHCTGGDVLIALSSLVLSLMLLGTRNWPSRRYVPVAALTIIFGISYTIFSEWLNIVVRESWAYSDFMPIIPVIDTGLSPVAQWVVVPLIAFWWARQLRSEHPATIAQAKIVPLRRSSHVKS
ncbi:hypothetical protein [Pseudaminobacter sp. NGMCC 1.201702]|uniref:hypothetical protein n=1 Tax=Pseudaminobacter sp. NGMCC 1.201702 TaxID=3391825 RepID=UPI0039EF7384